MDAAFYALRQGYHLSGKDGILIPLIKQLTEAVIKDELDTHLQNKIVRMAHRQKPLKRPAVLLS